MATAEPASETPSEPPLPRAGLLIKRLLDVILGTALFALACPIILLAAMALAVNLRAWPFFVHERIGFRGRPIAIPKLRTLSPRTPAYTDKRSLDETDISRLANFLRRTHIDELPQLLLVPIGQMSLVGPRPKMPDWVEPVDPEFGRLRTSIRPGCTGLWQIGSDTHYPVAHSPAYDCVYLTHRNMRLDLWILWRTALAMSGIGSSVGPKDAPTWTRTGAARNAAARATASVLTEEPEVAPELS